MIKLKKNQRGIFKQPNPSIKEDKGFCPHHVQRELFQAYTKFENVKDERGWYKHVGAKRIAMNLRRQIGKTLSAVGLSGISGYFAPGAPHIYMFNTFGQAWEALFESETYLDILNEDYIKDVNKSRMVIRFQGDAYIKAVGIDRNAQKCRGWKARMLIPDEYAHCQNETVFSEVFEPMIQTTDGTIVIPSTPNGHNDFYHRYHLYEERMRINPDRYFTRTVPFNQSIGLLGLTLEELEERFVILARRLGEHRAMQIIKQEYFCSWDAASASAIWGAEMEAIYKEGRILNLHSSEYGYPDRAFPIHTAFDIATGQGGDETVCIAFQIIPDHEAHTNRVLILDYYASIHKTVGDMIDEWIKPNKYDSGYMIVPHDFKGVYHLIADPVKQLRSQGIKLRILPQPSGKGKDYGINMARDLLRVCWFDKKCELGTNGSVWNLIRALREYRGEYDAIKDIERPLHNRASHWADAFRYLAVGITDMMYDPKVNPKQRLYNTDGLPWKRNDIGSWSAKDIEAYFEFKDAEWNTEDSFYDPEEDYF